MKFTRWMHHLYANLNGKFWLPCPRCGREFGGHEWNTNEVGSYIIDETEVCGSIHRGTCPNCPKHYDMHGVETEYTYFKNIGVSEELWPE